MIEYPQHASREQIGNNILEYTKFCHDSLNFNQDVIKLLPRFSLVDVLEDLNAMRHTLIKLRAQQAKKNDEIVLADILVIPKYGYYTDKTIIKDKEEIKCEYGRKHFNILDSVFKKKHEIDHARSTLEKEEHMLEMLKEAKKQFIQDYQDFLNQLARLEDKNEQRGLVLDYAYRFFLNSGHIEQTNGTDAVHTLFKTYPNALCTLLVPAYYHRVTEIFGLDSQATEDLISSIRTCFHELFEFVVKRHQAYGNTMIYYNLLFLTKPTPQQRLSLYHDLDLTKPISASQYCNWFMLVVYDTLINSPIHSMEGKHRLTNDPRGTSLEYQQGSIYKLIQGLKLIVDKPL